MKDIDCSHLDVLREVAADIKKKDIDGPRKKLESDGFPSLVFSSVLAYLLIAEGNFPEAIPLYVEAIKYGDSVAMNNLALRYFQLKKNKKEALHLQKNRL